MREIESLEIHDMQLARLVIEPGRVEIHVRTATVFYVDHAWGADDDVFASCLLICGGVKRVEVGEWLVQRDYVHDGRVVLADGTVRENMIEHGRFANGPAPIQGLWLGLAARNTAVDVSCTTLELRDIVVRPAPDRMQSRSNDTESSS